MPPVPEPPTQFPTIGLIVRHGHRIALICAALILAAGLLAGLFASWLWFAAALPVAALSYLLLRSYWELVRVIDQTLIAE